MARPQLQSRSTPSSPQERSGRRGRALIALAWVAFTCLTAASVAYSFRIYAALASDGDGVVDAGGGKLRGGGGGAAPSSRRTDAGGGGGAARHSSADADPNYALLYPNGDCVGVPVRIPYSSAEAKCQHCRDFCNVRFQEKEETPNVLPWTSMFVFGDRAVEVIGSCIGTFNYKDYATVKVVRPGDGCVNLNKDASHARFADKK